MGYHQAEIKTMSKRWKVCHLCRERQVCQSRQEGWRARVMAGTLLLRAYCGEETKSMENARVIETLNKAIALEHAATIQYKQHALLVRGLWRRTFADYFFAASRSAQEHAYRFGQKVVALGGVPTVEVGTVHQTLEVEEMLRQDLELERAAMQAYLEAHALAEDDVALRTLLEEQIKDEQRDIEELELYLNLVHTGAVKKEVHLQAVG
jgi:bacterioferritin (cytochrome b1)